ncbi:MAG: DUF3375 domain-containing protein [Treponema sp.]|nr:DUF3375 domain-containing protein [Treponema sp.]
MHNTSAGYFSSLIAQDAGMKLLRSHAAHLTISFLYGTFREKHVQVIPSGELESQLAVFLQEHRNEELLLDEEMGDDSSVQFAADFSAKKELFNDLQIKAKLLVSLWCSDEKAYIRRYHSAEGIPVVELSASVERLFTWLENSEPTQFVGTESRFQNILLQLRDLKEHTTEDPAARIAELREAQRKIDEEIREIKSTGRAQTYSAVQIRERLESISRSSRELLGDFRQIEDNFRSILQEIYREQSEVEATRGTILGYTLDTNHKMRVSPQGQTFSSFWDFISQDSDDEIGTLVNAILDSAETKDTGWSDTFLTHLKLYLYQAGHKIVEQNRVLTDRINRILSQQEVNERRLVTQLTADIKKEMLVYLPRVDSGAAQVPPDFLSVEGRPELFFPQARYPVFPLQTNDFTEMHRFDEQTIDPSSLRELFTQFYIDEKVLQKHAAEFRSGKNGGQFTLAELITTYPVEKGLAEIVAWYGMAEHTDRMQVLPDRTDVIQFNRNGSVVSVTVPRMLFV